jgi:hypothetical protein
MNQKQIEREKLRMFDTGSNKRNKSRWVQLIEAEQPPKRRGRPVRTTKKRRRT